LQFLAAGVIPGYTRRTIAAMPSLVGHRDNSGASVAGSWSSRLRAAPPGDDKRDLIVDLPSSPPVLTPGGARALVRVLLKASRGRSPRTVHHEGDTDVLAS